MRFSKEKYLRSQRILPGLHLWKRLGEAFDSISYPVCLLLSRAPRSGRFWIIVYSLFVFWLSLNL